jgi:arylsulfatase A-like enzyme
MIDHDKNVGAVLKALDDAGISDNTFVMYSTDNGPNMFSWPDGAMTPFRNEKNTNWEGAYRVPCVVRWPGKIKPGSVSNEIVAHHDWLPTFLAMAGDADVTDKLSLSSSRRMEEFSDAQATSPCLYLRVDLREVRLGVASVGSCMLVLRCGRGTIRMCPPVLKAIS